MEIELYKSKYVILTNDKEKEIFSLRFFPETANMLNEEWKELMQKILEIIEEIKPKYILDDSRERLYAYPPDIQNWTLNLFINSWNSNTNKYVQILPKDVIGKLSAGQIEEMANIKFSSRFDNKFVEDYESAINWLKE